MTKDQEIRAKAFELALQVTRRPLSSIGTVGGGWIDASFDMRQVTADAKEIEKYLRGEKAKK